MYRKKLINSFIKGVNQRVKLPYYTLPGCRPLSSKNRQDIMSDQSWERFSKESRQDVTESSTHALISIPHHQDQIHEAQVQGNPWCRHWALNMWQCDSRAEQLCKKTPISATSYALRDCTPGNVCAFMNDDVPPKTKKSAGSDAMSFSLSGMDPTWTYAFFSLSRHLPKETSGTQEVPWR